MKKSKFQIELIQKTFNAKAQRRKGAKGFKMLVGCVGGRPLVWAGKRALQFESCRHSFAPLRLCVLALNSDRIIPVERVFHSRASDLGGHCCIGNLNLDFLQS